MDYADVSFPVAKSIKVDLRNPETSTRRSTRSAVRCTRCSPPRASPTDRGHHEDQLHRPPSHHRPAHRRREDAVGLGHRPDLVGRRPRLGEEPRDAGDFLGTTDYETGAKWIEAHEGTDNYSFSKQAINAYVGREAFPLLKQGIRINAILPGPTDTPLARANADMWLTSASDYREATGAETLTPIRWATCSRSCAATPPAASTA